VCFINCADHGFFNYGEFSNDCGDIVEEVYPFFPKVILGQDYFGVKVFDRDRVGIRFGVGGGRYLLECGGCISLVSLLLLSFGDFTPLF
jgi:hypothetical protein